MSATHLAAALSMVTFGGTALCAGPFGESEQTPFASALSRGMRERFSSRSCFADGDDLGV